MAELTSGKVMIGHKLRRLRNTLKLSQSDMAAELGISASYLNLLENNVRPVTVPILFRLGQTYDVDLRDISEDDSARLTALLSEAFADPALEGADMSRRDIQQLANQHPNAANAFLALHRAYEAMREAARSGEQVSQQSRAPRPLDAVRRVLEAEANYFPEIEEAAEKFLAELSAAMPEANWQQSGAKAALLIGWLEQKYGIRTRIMPQSVMGSVLRELDMHRARLLLSESLKEPQRIFQLSTQIALLGYRDIIDGAIEKVALPEEEDTQTLLRIALSSYFAGAVMMPYTAFAAAARELRHDIDALASRFTATFEQVCHRLTSLNRPSDRGIPFFFLRVDEAGYISKRLSAGGIEFARQGGACGRWIPHKAFRTPGHILTQASTLEQGQKLLTIACTHKVQRTQPAHYGTPVYAIALGCDLKYAKDICYADNLGNLRAPALTPIGLGCRVCERANCQHRGALPGGQNMRFDLSKRYSGLFDSMRS